MTVPTHRPISAWRFILAGKMPIDMAQSILSDMVGYHKKMPRVRARDAASLAAAIEAIQQEGEGKCNLIKHEKMLSF